MNRTIVVLLWLLPIALRAQSADERKLQELYSQDKFERCLRLSDKYIASEKYKNQAFPYLYKALALQQLVVEKTGKIEINTIRTSYNAAREGKKRDKKNKVFSHQHVYYDSLIHYYHYLSYNLIQASHRTEARSLVTRLSKDFNDTLDLYYQFYPLSKAEKAERERFVPVASEVRKFEDSVVALACTKQFCAYQYGADGPQTFDCSGFIQYVYSHFGIKLPHSAQQISERGEEIDIKDIRKGDLLCFGTGHVNHVSMYISEEGEEPKIIHSVSRGVAVDDFNENSWWGKQPVYKVVRVRKDQGL